MARRVNMQYDRSNYPSRNTRKRQDNAAARAAGMAIVTLFVGGGLVLSVTLLVAIVAALVKFIGWAVGA